MHFSKAYARLLLTLPAELRENTIQYGQLKRLIKELINELESLGLNPAVLPELLEPVESGTHAKAQECTDAYGVRQLFLKSQSNRRLPKLVYEFSCDDQPRLRLRVKTSYPRDEPPPNMSGLVQIVLGSDRSKGTVQSSESTAGVCLSISSSGAVEFVRAKDIGDFRDSTPKPGVQRSLEHIHAKATGDIFITLVSDTTFFQLLSNGIGAISAHLLFVSSRYITTLKGLSRSISLTARPVSWTTSPSAIFKTTKSDLYAWREIFQIYVEAEIFETIGEAARGGRTVEESERRLQSFAERLRQKGLSNKRTFKMQESQAAFKTFWELNMCILNLKKFQHANAEAARKILKKHAKRTGLPLSLSIDDVLSFSQSQRGLTAQFSTSLFSTSDLTALSPRIIIQAIGETLLPLIPRIDDYMCLICTSIAFTPIRLSCGHFFCVRCLVKMQKRSQGDCPMCRAPVVLLADRSNVDWALQNFLQDWFPVETKVKRKNNEREAGEEELREMGFGERTCTIA